MTGAIRLRPGWVRVMILVYWLLTSAALVATAVNELAPSASGTPKKTNRPFGFDVVVAPVGSRVTVTLGSVSPTKVTVASVVMPLAARRRVGVDVEVEDRSAPAAWWEPRQSSR